MYTLASKQGTTGQRSFLNKLGHGLMEYWMALLRRFGQLLDVQADFAASVVITRMKMHCCGYTWPMVQVCYIP